ncbi:MAG: YopX family protein [Dehalococcoidales bacterium]|nr:YopX family protein [Dehalococcoidales bacterium]
MQEIKFRQALMVAGKFTGWHYWGFIDGKFVSPARSDDEFASTKPKYNQQFIGLPDKDNKEIYEGDRLYDGRGYYRTVHFVAARTGWHAGNLRLTRVLASNLAVVSNVIENPDLLKG